jgi:nitrogen-specific signal transduction histidine kinase
MFGTVQDITDRKNLEEQLQQSQKMEAIGKLAGGVAHDFNNLLTVINGYSDILLADLASNLPEYEDLQQIKRAGLRAASLTNQLLAFSRKQVLKLEILNVNDLLNNLEQMLERLIGEDIELITCREKDLAEIKADRGQIEQIIVNLAVNGRDAMPRGGELLIRTQNTFLDEEFIRQNCRIKPGPYVLISISDTGMGMNRQILDHIFEPFFTTKDVGKGTGLGLSTVYGIVKQSGGDVCVQSEPGIGTIFDIYLPAIARTVIADRQSPECAQSFVGTETILLVEDEKSVLSLVQKTLERRGYHLITATDGVEALDAIKKYKKNIHLLLSDVVMPNMSGKELAEKIGPFHPETIVCFMSGYTDDAIIRHGVLDAKVHFIQKPFSPESLSKRVREILDTR